MGGGGGGGEVGRVEGASEEERSEGDPSTHPGLCVCVCVHVREKNMLYSNKTLHHYDVIILPLLGELLDCSSVGR